MRIHPFAGVATSLILALILALTTTASVMAGVSTAWTHQFGGTGTDIAHSVAVDADRNVYVAGRVSASGDQCILRRYRADGRRVWKRVFGTPTGDCCRDVAVAPNGAIYVVGSTHGSLGGPSAGGRDGFVRKYRRDGTVAWTRQFGSDDTDLAYAVAVDKAGDVVVVGSTAAAIGNNHSRGAYDVFVRKYRSSGKHKWTRQFGTNRDDWGIEVAIDSSRRIVITGRTHGSLGAPYQGGGDVFVRTLQRNGDHVWTRQFGTSFEDSGNGLAIAGDDRIYVVGATKGILPNKTSHGQRDGFIRKLRPNGRAIWTRQFGTPGNDRAEGAALDSQGRLYVAGQLEVLAGDGFVMKVTPKGSQAWIRKVGGTTSEEGLAVAVDRLRHVYLVGSTNGTLANQTSHGDWDAWIRKYRP